MTIASNFNSFGESAFKKRVISNAVELIDPIDTPLLEAIGGLNGGAGVVSFSNPPSTKVEWVKDTYIPVTSTITEPIAAVDTLEMTVADGNLIQPGDYVKIDNEYVWVSAVSGNVCTITRAFNGSNAAAHLDNAPIEIVSMARLEGAEVSFRGATTPTVDYNYSQIFEQGLKRTGSQQLINYEAIPDYWGYQANKRMPEMLRKIEKALLWQNRVADADFVIGKARHFGGLPQFITTNATTATNLDAVSQVLDLKMIDDLIRLPFNYGASGEWIGMVNPTDYVAIKALYDAKNWITVDQNVTKWGFNVQQSVTSFGIVNWVMNRYLPSLTMYMLKPEYMGLVELRPFAIRDLPATGDYEQNDLVGEYTFVLTHEKYMAKLTGYTLS
jgi:hypothetical protein